MTPILPDSAPFSPAQRAWLNGFFAGLLGAGAATDPMQLPALADLHAPQPPIAEPETFPWHDPALSMDERLALAEGKAPALVLMAAMAQLDCGSCGYDCRAYAEAIDSGEETDLTKCTPGGAPTARMLKTLRARPRSESLPVLPAVRPSTPTTNGTNGTAPGYSRKHPVPARVLQVERLNGPGSEKEVRHVALDLGSLKYEVGDALGVLPTNCPELVAALLTALGASGDEPVTTRGGDTLPVRDTLARRCALNKVSGILPLLASWASDPAEAQCLQALADDDPEGELEGADLLDVLERFPSARGPAAELVAALPPLQPRLYSIASSLKAHPGQVHLTVSIVRYTRNGSARGRKGVASTFLADRVGPGETVDVFVQPSHGFRLPERGDTPVLMVGPGTGIAPFRAFLQERHAAGARGKNWLFFGDQRRDCDYLYRDELEGYRERGLLARLDLAFSRDQVEKVYVQHRMLESAGEVWTWLEQGAHLYVCGDASRMARDVDQTLHQIVREQGGLTGEAARAYVSELKQAKRYQRDVY
jgi:sulfite reductase (NADPH) flavoprotein alpha-component